MKYEFKNNPERPHYVLVSDPSGTVVSELWHTHAMVIFLMYSNMRKQDLKAANEFMYGHILGMTYYALHAEKYPKVTVEDHGNGHKTLHMENQAASTDGNALFDADLQAALAVDTAAQEQITQLVYKLFSKKKDH